jgi:hypothetical protein
MDAKLHSICQALTLVTFHALQGPALAWGPIASPADALELLSSSMLGLMLLESWIAEHKARSCCGF